MEETLKHIAGCRLATYLLILTPPPHLADSIVKIKKDFAAKYDCPQAATSLPHITLSQFTLYNTSEPRIIRRIRTIIEGQKNFLVTLKDFGNFPTHTLYIQVQTQDSIRTLVRELKQAQSLLKTDKFNKPYFTDEPHLTIARKLLPWQHEKGWLEMSNSHFTGSFIASEVVLLRRFEGERNTTIARFSLLGNAVKITQQQLF
jgi:2'-5' RNA ligase